MGSHSVYGKVDPFLGVFVQEGSSAAPPQSHHSVIEPSDSFMSTLDQRSEITAQPTYLSLGSTDVHPQYLWKITMVKATDFG